MIQIRWHEASTIAADRDPMISAILPTEEEIPAELWSLRNDLLAIASRVGLAQSQTCHVKNVPEVKRLDRMFWHLCDFCFLLAVDIRDLTESYFELSEEWRLRTQRSLEARLSSLQKLALLVMGELA